LNKTKTCYATITKENINYGKKAFIEGYPMSYNPRARFPSNHHG